MEFEIAGGSATGRNHVASGRNNQDALAWITVGDGLAAAVCDGCGSGAHSEVGAKLGARLVVEAAARQLGKDLEIPDLLERIGADVLGWLRPLVAEMGGERAVRDYFLFTVIGLLIDGGRAITFGLGDGLVVVNGERRTIGPFADNQPPYLGYALLQDADRGVTFALQMLKCVPAADLHSVLLGTDGAVDLDCPLDRFWSDDLVFANPDMIRRRLTVARREAGGSGPIGDDTTLIVVRRKAA